MNRFTCACGRVYVIKLEEETMKRGFLKRLWGLGEYESSRPWETSVQAPALTVQRSPVLERHVDLPFSQALRSGLLAGLVLSGVALLFAKAWWHPLAAFAAAFAVVSCIVWFVFMLKDRKLLWLAESLTGVDLNRDGAVGEPKTTIVDFVDRDKKHQYKVMLPIDSSTMSEIAHAMLKSRGRYNFSRRDMMAATSVSDEAFEKVQKEFLRRGWATYRKEGKPNTGVILLASGRAVLRKYL